MTGSETIVANAVVIVGAVLQASTGLGAGLLVVPLLALIDQALVPGPIIVASMVVSFLMAYQGRREIAFSGMQMLFVGLVAGSALAAGVIAQIPRSQLSALFGVLIILAVGISVAGFVPRRSRESCLIAGALSGFMGTTAGIGAPVLALLYQRDPGMVIRPTLGFLYLTSSVLMLGLLSIVGRFGITEIQLGAMLMPGVLIGFMAAQSFARVIDRGYSRIAILAISTASAVVLIARNVFFAG